MRFHGVAIAALGLLGVSDCKTTSTSLGLASSSDAAAKDSHVENGDFSNGLQGYKTTGSVAYVPGVGYNGKDGAIKMESANSSSKDKRGNIITSSKRQQITTTGVTQSLKSLTVGATYSVSFKYYVIFATSQDSCRIQAYADSNNFGNTDYFDRAFIIGSTWATFTGNFVATSASQTLKLNIVCGSGTSQVYLDSVSVTKAAATTAKTTSTTAKTTSTSTVKTTSTNAAVSVAAAAVSSSTSTKATSTTSTSTSAAQSTTTTKATSTASTSAASSSATTSSGSSSSASTSSGSSSSASASSGSSTGTVSTGTSTTGSSTASIQSTSATSIPSGTVDSTILIIAPNTDSAASGSAGLLGYGIPFENLIVSKDGTALPTLNSSATHGNYGGIIVMDAVSYEYTTGWASAITDDQWKALYAYQLQFNVRMVRINEYPGVGFGTTTTSGGGCCADTVSQNISFTDTSDFPTANIKANAELSTSGLWHVPAVITDTTTTKQVAKFGVATGFSSETVAAVINNFNGREQFVWFIGWAPVWSLTSNFLQHAHIHWMTRGVFLGKRKTHLSAQIDDVQISTELYYPTGLPDFKIAIADLEAHVTWQKNLNARLPTGSSFYLELGHNGNGDIISSTIADQNDICSPADAVYYDSPNATALEFQKVLGTGVDIWPTGYETYNWTLPCAKLDDFASWFMTAANRDAFAHVSHTFTHLSLNNATYHDANREIKFNQAWMKQTTIDQAKSFSAHGLIPPAITGMHNGDAIKAWLDNGITYVVGDNTRPVLRNSANVYWPLITSVANNGYDGLTIVPRFSTAIYFNCHTMECTTKEWIATSAGSGDYFSLLASSKASNIRNLLALQSDPYMFHQANMHQTTVDSITIGTQSGKMSLVMSWTETMVQELMRLTNWPILSMKHDDIAQYFLNRKAVDDCSPKMSYSFSNDGTTIKSVTVTATGNTCSVPIPITIPSGSVSGGTVTADKVGSEPPIQWVTLSGSPVTLTLSSPVAFNTSSTSTSS